MNNPTISDSVTAAAHLKKLQLNQKFTSALQGECGASEQSRQVANAMWSEVAPTPPRAPQLIAWVPEVADFLGIDIASDPLLAARIFTGAHQLDGSLPYAMRYGGHQFGNWAGQLGDGRAIALGELQDKNNQSWTLQLKGAGPTPYSRQGDGYAVLRSSVREYLCSEAIHHLGIPTTRSLTLSLTGEDIQRDVFYNGNIEIEPGAILCRVAESFVRFGSFEIHAAHRENDLLKQLADYVITQHYPHLLSGKTPNADTYQQWFNELLERTAKLMAHWQRVGFVHAVMNTDNMSILGQTIDYGPYGWLEEYDLRWTPNFVDLQGRRYSYGNQPHIALWNLYRLANAILPLFDDNTGPLEEVLKRYEPLYESLWNDTRAAKAGLSSYEPKSGDKELLDDLWNFLEQASPDYTLFFRTLADAPASQTAQALADDLNAAFYDTPGTEHQQQLSAWLERWKARIKNEGPQAQKLMQATNPKYVLRNYIAIQAIDAAERGDYSVLEEVASVMQNPYDDQPQYQKYAALRPDWATQRPGCTMLTCSS